MTMEKNTPVSSKPITMEKVYATVISTIQNEIKFRIGGVVVSPAPLNAWMVIIPHERSREKMIIRIAMV